MSASRTLTGNVLETMCAAAFPLAIGDVQTDRHGPTHRPVAVGGDPHTQQTLQRKTTWTPDQTGIYFCVCATPSYLLLVIHLALLTVCWGGYLLSLSHTNTHTHTHTPTHTHTHAHTYLIAIFAVNTGLLFPL